MHLGDGGQFIHAISFDEFPGCGYDLRSGALGQRQTGLAGQSFHVLQESVAGENRRRGDGQVTLSPMFLDQLDIPALVHETGPDVVLVAELVRHGQPAGGALQQGFDGAGMGPCQEMVEVPAFPPKLLVQRVVPFRWNDHLAVLSDTDTTDPCRQFAALGVAQFLGVPDAQGSQFLPGSRLHQDAAHQVAVFNDPLMDEFKALAEDQLGVKLLSVMYLGRRQVNLRQSKEELTVMTPADLDGVNLRMPGTDAWQFLGKALGAAPTPMAFSEVYTALSTGAVDGQDNPLPTVVDAKFYEVTGQIVLTSHLVDLNYIAIGKGVWEGMTPEQQARFQQAADAAAESGRQKQLQKEDDLVAFLEEQGLDIYEPDLAAFRNTVQGMYLESDFASSWPEGVLDRINALGS